MTFENDPCVCRQSLIISATRRTWILYYSRILEVEMGSIMVVVHYACIDPLTYHKYWKRNPKGQCCGCITEIGMAPMAFTPHTIIVDSYLP